MAPPPPDQPRKNNPARPSSPDKARGQGGAKPKQAQGTPRTAKPVARAVAANPRDPRRAAVDGDGNGMVPVRLVAGGAGAAMQALPVARRVGDASPRAAPAPPNRPIPVREIKPGELPDAYDVDEEEEEDLTEVVRTSPAMLASVVVHLLLLICLGLYAAVEQKEVDIPIVASVDNVDETLPLTGDPGNNPLENLKGQDNETEITDQSLPLVDDPYAAPIESETPNLKGTTFTPSDKGSVTEGLITMNMKPKIAGAIGFALRGTQHGRGKRNKLGNDIGGGVSPATEAAVLKGLEWLARQQQADGSWSLIGPYSAPGRIENKASATAMALLAFQGHGDTPVAGKFAGVVAKGWKYLSALEDNGYYSRDVANPQHRLYTQAQCSIAACELYGMTNDAQYRPAAERAVAYAVKAQDPKLGGWRYDPGTDSDLSVTGWFVIALQSARMAQLEVPEETLQKVVKFLDLTQYDGGRQYYYRPGSEPTPAVTAEGLLCRQYLGYKQDDPRMLEGAAALNRNPINYARDQNKQDVYYWYYATQVCHHMENPTVGGKKWTIWDEWNNVMKVVVPAHQTPSGPEAGSWDPGGDKWGSEGGRLYVTCLSIYMLEVYYRHLPIYSGYKALVDAGVVSGSDGAVDGKAADQPAVEQVP